MSKLYEDCEKNVSSRLFTCCHYIHIKKTAPLPGGHVFSLIMTIFKLVQDIHITNAKDVTSRVKKTPPCGHVFLPIQTIIKLNCPIKVKNAPPLGSHVFQAIFALIQDIIGTNHLSKVLTRKNAPPPGGHVFQPTDIIFKLIQDIIETNLLTNYHEDWTINANVDVAQRTTQDGQRTKGDHKSSP
ncbi:hypothetical protein DPMN_156490 [Dreissena polymorpha]|uniref:Uncharacterized protein n=1 Tax=Dreissena polymorpha TaxID=45954 RepID=A0A9D4J7M7_DREPO|nr:hypothetical protein DPMN_156490 [Dreissena polymorpha]